MRDPSYRAPLIPSAYLLTTHASLHLTIMTCTTALQARPSSASRRALHFDRTHRPAATGECPSPTCAVRFRARRRMLCPRKTKRRHKRIGAHSAESLEHRRSAMLMAAVSREVCEEARGLTMTGRRAAPLRNDRTGAWERGKRGIKIGQDVVSSGTVLSGRLQEYRNLRAEGISCYCLGNPNSSTATGYTG